jgi:hypothetical protein
MEINGLGSGWAHSQTPMDVQWVAVQKAKVSGKKAGAVKSAIDPSWAWGIDGSYFVKNPLQVIKDAVAAGASFVLWKASDGVQLVAGSTSAEKNYVDPSFYDVVQLCHTIVCPDGTVGVPVGGYHFFHEENDFFAAPVIDSPSADMQWRTMKTWQGLPMAPAVKAPRVIQMSISDLEGHLLADGKTYDFQEDGPVVIQTRLKIWMEWMRNMINTTVDPYLLHSLLYTSPGYINSYAKNVVVDIDAKDSYLLWLATWWFVKKAITSFTEISALLATVTALPTLGNYAEKTVLCQVGTVGYTVTDPTTGIKTSTEVDINIVKKTKADLYTWANLPFAPVPVDHTCNTGYHWSDPDGKCIPDTPVDHGCTPTQTWDPVQQKCIDNEPPVGDLTDVIAKLDQVLANQVAFKAKLDKYPG